MSESSSHEPGPAGALGGWSPVLEHGDVDDGFHPLWNPDESLVSSSMDIDSGFLDDEYYAAPTDFDPAAVSETVAAPTHQAQYEDDEDDGDDDEEFEFDGEYDSGAEQSDDEAADDTGSVKSNGQAPKSNALTPSHRSRTSSPKRASPTRDTRSIPSVSLLYAPKRDARAVRYHHPRQEKCSLGFKTALLTRCVRNQVLGRQYFDEPLAVFREAHSEVFIVQKKEKSRGDEFKTFAVKRQHLADPDNLSDKAFRELRILMQLRRLQERQMCENFVFLRDWIKSVPPLMFPVSGKYGSEDQFIYFELEYAPKSLRSIKTATLAEFKSILFQCLYALYVAQKEYKFVHNDLHAKNVLLQDSNPERPFLAFQDFDRVWYTSGYVVKITDFGLSRLQLETREVVFNPRNSFGEMFSSSRDLEKLSQELPKISNWSEVANAEEQRSWLRILTQKMRSMNAAPKDLLRESFFDELATRPEAANSSTAAAFASHGNTNNLKRILDGEKVNLPPINDPAWLSEDKDLLAEQYAAMAQLQERFRILRTQQPNLYIKYIAKSYTKLPRKKKPKKVPTGPRPPRPPKPKPLVPMAAEPKPVSVEPIIPQAPPTRDERRKQNDAVRWFREMREVADGLAKLGAALGPRKARLKQESAELSKPSKPKPAPQIPAKVDPIPKWEPIELNSSLSASPTKTAPRIKLIMTAPQVNSAHPHPDEDGEVDIMEEDCEPAPMAVKAAIATTTSNQNDGNESDIEIDDSPESNPAPPPQVVSEPSFAMPSSLSAVQMQKMDTMSYQPVALVRVASEPITMPEEATSDARTSIELSQRHLVAPSAMPSETPSSQHVPTPPTAEPRKRGRRPKEPAATSSLSLPTEAPQKKRSLASIMREIANNCGSFEKMFTAEPLLGRRRGSRATDDSPSKPQVTKLDASPLLDAPESVPDLPSLVVVLEHPHSGERSPSLSHLATTHQDEMEVDKGVTDDLGILLDEADASLLPIEDRGRSRAIKKRKRSFDTDDTPQAKVELDDESSAQVDVRPPPAAAFNSECEEVIRDCVVAEEDRSTKRQHVVTNW